MIFTIDTSVILKLPNCFSYLCTQLTEVVHLKGLAGMPETPEKVSAVAVFEITRLEPEVSYAFEVQVNLIWDDKICVDRVFGLQEILIALGWLALGDSGFKLGSLVQIVIKN